MHQGADPSHRFCTLYRMSRRHQRRKEKVQRHATASSRVPDPRPIIRQASRVERLAYTRTQAAEALGISRSTLNRLLPFVETVKLPWGTTLIPVDEVERLLAERRCPARSRRGASRRGRPPTVTPDILHWIKAARVAGMSLREIASELNATCTPTAHGGARWWPSTVRSVLLRVS